MIRRKRPQARRAALGPACLLLLLVHLLAPSQGQFEEFPLPGDLVEPPGSLQGLDVRTLDLLDPSEAARADTEALLGSLTETFPVDHQIIGTKLLLQGESGALDRIESVLADMGLVAERHTCEMVPLYYVRDADSVNSILAELTRSASALDEVSITTTSARDARPALVLYGPRSQVDDLRRVIAAIDVPHPEVRLDIWAFQISGSNADRVADRAKQADECIRTVADLIRGYLDQLENCALEEQRRNQTPDYPVFGLFDGADSSPTGAPPREAEAMGHRAPQEGAPGPAGWGGTAGLLSRMAVGQPDGSELLESPKMNVEIPDIAMGIRPTGTQRVAVVPSARGVHPLSLTETLATLILLRPRGGSVRETLEGDLRRHLVSWLAEADPSSLATWRRLMESDNDGDDGRLVALLASLQGALPAGEDGAGQPQSAAGTAADALLPERLLETFRDEGEVDVAQVTLSGFLLDWKTNARDWRSLPPDRLGRRAADARRVLQGAERALAEDIQRLFLRPLVGELRRLASQGGRGGLAEAGQTSISVLSGTQAEVVGSAVSYFDVGAQPQPELSTMVAGGQFPGMLEATLRESPEVWSVLTSGAELTVTPHVLPGGGSAELEICLRVNHEDRGVETAGARAEVVPLSRVAQHKADTKVYVDSLDVFGLSSLRLRTAQPRPDLAVPVLSGIPLLGEMFQFPRGPNTVHHESMLLVVSTVLPTGMDLGTTLDFEAYEAGT